MKSFIMQPQQRGATLLISLVLLLVLTILALAAGRNATLQQRMASNLQQQNLAFQYAENGIQAAILRLQDESTRPQQSSPKCLFSDTGTGVTEEWADNCNSADNNGYVVEVEEVDCTGAGGIAGNSGGAVSIGVGSNTINLTGGTCYRITSRGRYQEAKAVHQQGYMF